MKMKIKIILLIAILSITMVRSGDPSQYQYQTPMPTTGQVTATSLATGDYAETSAESKATATQGNVGVGIGVANAQTDTVKTGSEALALADAGSNQSVTNNVYNRDSASYQGYLEDDGVVGATHTNNFATNYRTTVNPDGNAIYENTEQSDAGTYRVIQNGRNTIIDNKTDSVHIDGSTISNANLVDTSSKRDVTITVDAGDEKLIVEKIIGNDQRVIIVSAAKFLLDSLAKDDVAQIIQLYKDTCNCRQVKNYLMELLAEAV
jgi:hypothetical protein